MICRTCGKVWSETSTVTGYHFSSASLPKGSYTSPFNINALGEEILTCGSDPMPEVDEAMYSGSDRRKAGDETDPRRP